MKYQQQLFIDKSRLLLSGLFLFLLRNGSGYLQHIQLLQLILSNTLINVLQHIIHIRGFGILHNCIIHIIDEILQFL